MKKIILLMGALFVLFAAGCSNSKPEPEQVTFSVDEGKQIINHFLTAVVKGEKDAQQNYLAGEAKNFSSKDIYATSFKILDANEIEAGAEYHGKLYEAKADQPYYAQDDFVITMKKSQQGDYEITKVVINKELTVQQKDSSLVVNEAGTDTSLVSLNDIPAQASPQQAKDKQLPVDKKTFGAIAMSPDKGVMLFSTNGKNAFLGLYSLSSKEVTPLDIYSDSKIKKITWSPDGNLYAVEEKATSGKSNIVLYDYASDSKISFKGIELFKDPEFDLTDPFFLENSYYYHVSAHKNKSISGWWVYNFGTKKLGKLLK